MKPKAVLISYNHPTTNTPLCGTGVLFENGLVLTHGTILVSLLSIPSQRSWMTSFLSELSGNVIAAPVLSKNVKFRIYQDSENDGVSSLPNVDVKGAWKCPLVSKSVRTLFHDWTMGDVTRGQDCNGDADIVDAARTLMAVFLLLGTVENHATLSSLLDTLAEPQRGQDVLIESTPFGSELFMNSLSRGIVSNVLGSQNCLLLTDARTVAGCEGGPIFGNSHLSSINSDKEKLLGMVSCSLTWWRGEWVGLTIGVALSPILRRVTRPEIPKPKISNNDIEKTVQNVIDEAVVLIRCGSSWGSGVIVDAPQGVVLTCAHVVSKAQNNIVAICHQGREFIADIIYQTENDMAFDIAVLRLRNPHPFSRHLEMDDVPPEKGEAVTAAGFPLFSEKEVNDLLPTLVKGCLARVTPSMIQTTCCIQSGASGGAILRRDKLLGLVASNAKDSNSGALFPHINFAIPVSTFRSQVKKYIETSDPSVLKSLESKDMAVQNIWRLQSSKL